MQSLGDREQNHNTVMTQRDVMGREVGGGFMFGNACTPVVDSCQCMAKLAFKKYFF